MNDLGSCNLRTLDAMYSSGLWKHAQLQVMSSMNNFRLWMTWTTQDRELWALDDMNNSRSLAQRSSCYEQLKAMVDMNDFRLWVKGFRCYEQFRDVDYMNDSVWWAQGSRCYEQLIVLDDMNDSGSHELRPLDAMNNLGFQMIWTVLGRKEKTPNVMNN